MMILIVLVSIVMFIATSLVLYYVKNLYNSTNNEVLISQIVADLGELEVKYLKAANQGKFKNYSHIKKNLEDVVSINNYISQNFLSWNKQKNIVKVSIAVDKDSSGMRKELESCDNEEIKEMVREKNHLFFQIYAIQHPIRLLLLKMLVFFLILLLSPLLLVYILVKFVVSLFNRLSNMSIRAFSEKWRLALAGLFTIESL